MKINIRTSAIRDLKKIDHKDKERIHSEILELKKFPAVSNIKKLTNFGHSYRFRVGDYRILLDVSEDIIEIGRILHRKDSYK
ncbi:MAG: type II toxin-antitoxin system RelE/ParE family toxin [Desulfococcaceae bacterium]